MTDPPAAYRLADYLPNTEEQRRYEIALLRLSMRPVSPARLAEHARLMHRFNDVRQALHDDPRYERVPGRARERYELRAPYRHAATLRSVLA